MYLSVIAKPNFLSHLTSANWLLRLRVWDPGIATDYKLTSVLTTENNCFLKCPHSLRQRANARNVQLRESFYGGQFTLSTQLTKPNYLACGRGPRWMHGKSVRQWHVRQADTMDRASTLPLNLGPSYMVSGTRDNPFREATLSSIYRRVGRVKVNTAWFFITLIKQSNVRISLFLLVFLAHSITVDFAELIFTSLIRISALNPKSRHYVTLSTPRVVPVRRPKAIIWRKVVPLVGVHLPAEVRQLAQPICLGPRDKFAILM